MHAGGASFIGSESYNHAGTGLGPDGNNIVVRNSYIHDNAVQGIYISGGDDWLIENKVFYNNDRYEIYNFGGKRQRISNNTIVAGPRNDFATPGEISAGIYLDSASQGSIHEYNIIDGFRLAWQISRRLPSRISSGTISFRATPGLRRLSESSA